MEKLTINGLDSSQNVYLQRNYVKYFTFKDLIFEFRKDRLNDEFSGLSFKRSLHTSPIDLFPAACDFNEKSHKEELFFITSATSFHFNSSNQIWNIIRLDQEKLILESIEDYRKIRFEYTVH